MPSVCGKRGHTEGILDPGKVQQNCAPPGRGFPSARRRGGVQLPPTRLRGEQGEAPSKGCNGGKPLRHHTTPQPIQTTPERTTTQRSPTHRHSTPHLTTQGTQPHHTRHHSKHNTNTSPPSKKRHFPPRKCTFLKSPPNPAQIDTQRYHHHRTLHPFGTRAPLYSKMTT